MECLAYHTSLAARCMDHQQPQWSALLPFQHAGQHQHHQHAYAPPRTVADTGGHSKRVYQSPLQEATVRRWAHHSLESEIALQVPVVAWMLLPLRSPPGHLASA